MFIIVLLIRLLGFLIKHSLKKLIFTLASALLRIFRSSRYLLFFRIKLRIFTKANIILGIAKIIKESLSCKEEFKWNKVIKLLHWSLMSTI